jgi:signal transduction histidine kinase
MSSYLGNHESQVEKIISEMEQLKIENDSLLASNEKLRSKIDDIDNQKNRKTSSLVFAENQFALLNKELVSANEKFAALNKEFALSNEQLKRYHVKQTEFIKTAAYELKSLTHAILGYSELLQMDFREENNNNDDFTNDSDITKQVLHVIVKSTNELQKLIIKILDVAKNENQPLNTNNKSYI